MTNTKRYIDLSADIRVGFNYIKQQYYITNKGKTVYSSNAQDIVDTVTKVFNLALAKGDLEECAIIYEELHDIYYTWQDNGAYIHTLQFNDFEQYPLSIDCEKQKLYIMNSNVVFDLTVDESIKQVRLPIIRAYYKDTLGLSISIADLEVLYNKLVSYYKPTCYNQIEVNEANNKPYYNNVFLSSNYDKSATVVYNCTRNPNDTVVPIESMPELAYITSTDSNTNSIYLTDVKQDIQEGSSVVVNGTDIVIAENPYSADGTYQVQSVYINSSNSIVGIVTNETLPISYDFPYIKCYVEATTCTVTSMSREDSTISVTGDIQYLLIGDKVIVRNASISNGYEVIDLSGEYTIQSITTHGNTHIIQVAEEIKTSYEGNATLVKGVLLGDVTEITSEGVITLINTHEVSVTSGNIYLSSDVNTSYTGESIVTGTVTISGTKPSQYNVAEVYPKLLYPEPSPEILINVTSVDESIIGVFPIGEFMVDNFDEAVAYIGQVAGLSAYMPTEETEENMYNEVPSSMSIEGLSTGINEMQFVGLYSQRYGEDM